MKEENINNRELKTTETKSNSELSCQVIQPNSFINGDCMEFMRTCPPNFFNLALVDPPYGIGAGKEKEHNGWKDYGQKEWDNKIPDKTYFDELFRISKNQIIWGGNYFTDYLPAKMGWIVWDKGQRDFSLADGELAWTSFDKALRIIDYPRALANQEDKIHPTQKPVFIYKQILKRYARQGDIILDTHAGSANCLRACKELGLDYLGFEIDVDYYNKAKLNLGRAFHQPELFGGAS